MKILIDINHPAHVHMFRCFAHEMINRGHNVLFTIRDKEFEIKLLEAEGLPYVNLGHKRTGKISRLLFNLQCACKVWRIARRFQADIFLSHGSIVAAYVAKLLGKPAIAFEDTFNMEQVQMYLPFTSVVLTSDYEHPIHSDKVIKYPGYNELLYMHPKRFQPMTREEVCRLLGIDAKERYVVLRFVSWHATHDRGHKGILLDNKLKAVQQMSHYAHVFISSESELPSELVGYKLPTAPEMIGHVMAHAIFVFGESATMVSEAAMLGVPGIYLDNTGRLYTRDLQERYGLCWCYTESAEDQEMAIAKGVKLLRMEPETLSKQMHEASQKLLSEKVDVTCWLVWLIESYPQSVSATRHADAEFWKQFK